MSPHGTLPGAEPVELPAYVQLEPVGQCNLRCQMCAIQFRPDGPPHGPPAFMDFDLFARLIDGFEGLRELHLQGLGEPLMHPRFFDMVAYAAARGIRVSTTSNLTLLTERRARLLVASGLDLLHVSIDGATPETYERIRVRAHFDRVVRNLERLHAIKAELGASRPRVHLTVVVMRQNLHELPDMVRRARAWGIEEVFVQHLCHDFGEAALPPRYRPMRAFVQAQTLLGEDAARIECYFDEARAAAAEVGVALRLPRTRPRIHPPGTPGRARCSWPWSSAYVSYQGVAMPCCMVSTPDRASVGNMAAQGVRTVWDGPAYRAFRAALDSDQPPEICRTCSIYTGTF